MKKITLKFSIFCLLASLVSNVAAQDLIQPEVIVLQNVNTNQPIGEKQKGGLEKGISENSSSTSERLYGRKRTAKQVGSKTAQQKPIYFLDGMQIDDLNAVKASSILDVTVQGNVIRITTSQGATVASN